MSSEAGVLNLKKALKKNGNTKTNGHPQEHVRNCDSVLVQMWPCTLPKRWLCFQIELLEAYSDEVPRPRDTNLLYPPTHTPVICVFNLGKEASPSPK